MPPKIKVSEEDIITKALCIVREQGIEALNARNVAAKLNSSVQPIFRVFSSMDSLRTVVIKRAEELYIQIMKAAFKSNEGFYAMGLAYINFAKMEPNLFRLLFMTNSFNQDSAVNIAGTTTDDDKVIAALCKTTGLDAEKARELYTGIWFTTHGIASLLATNNCTLNENETKKILTNCFDGLAYLLQKS